MQYKLCFKAFHNIKSLTVSLIFIIMLLYIQLSKMNITPLAILGVKWPFSKGRGG